jgi:hypothetical protein
MRFICVLLLLFLPSQYPYPDMPSSPGIYFRQENGKWLNLPTASFSGMKIKGLKSYIDTAGYTVFVSGMACSGAHAGTRIKQPKPVFYVRGLGSSQSIMLLQLEVKKNSRSLQTSPADATMDNKAGFKKESMKKLDVIEYPDQSFSVAPQKGLKAGEYLLTFGDTASGYDFGID